MTHTHAHTHTQHNTHMPPHASIHACLHTQRQRKTHFPIFPLFLLHLFLALLLGVLLSLLQPAQRSIHQEGMFPFEPHLLVSQQAFISVGERILLLQMCRQLLVLDLVLGLAQSLRIGARAPVIAFPAFIFLSAFLFLPFSFLLSFGLLSFGGRWRWRWR